MEQHEAKGKLAALLRDIDFDTLSLRMKDPNIFDTLRITRTEIRHSDFLCWLLDPGENHGLGDIFLRKFLRDIFSDEKVSGRSIIDADILDLSGIDIRREWCHIDILIILEKDVIVIENKIDSQDHSNQLMRYKEIVDSAFSDKKIYKHYVYLTQQGTDPINEISQDYYSNYSYREIVEILKTILEIHDNSIPTRTKIYIEDYYNMLRRTILMNDEMNQLAEKIYNSHKDAIELIFNNRPDPATMLYPHFAKAIEKRNWILGSKNKGVVRFVPKELYGLLPKDIGIGWPGKELFMFEIDYFWNNKTANCTSVIAPSNSNDLRDKIHNALQDSSYYIKPRGKKWIVNYRKKISFSASQMVNEEDDVIIKKVENILNEVSPVVEDFAKLLVKAFSE